tara:strand:- start:101 stop:1180 length:1080 start_codon:yes stop_codon:yes gene_type:complete
MKKLVLVLALAVAFIGCEKETVIVIEDNGCEDCQGAIINLAPQARGPVNRDAMYAWIDVITVVAEDENGNDYGNEFELVDDNSGANGFFLEEVPTGQIIDFSASSTSKDDGAGEFLVEADPNNLDVFVNRMPFAEYATDAPVSQYIENGDNLVYLQMNTNHGRLISSFQLANNIQSGYNLVVTKGNNAVIVTGASGVVSYWNTPTSLSGEDQTFVLEVKDIVTGQVVYTRTITETIVASTSTTNKYVVGLGFVEDSTVEVIFTWQPWEDNEGEDETSSCGTLTNMNVSGSYSLTQDTVLEDVNLVVAGDLNLNGYTLTLPCGGVTVSGNFNGGGTLIHCGDLIVTGATQNNPTINQQCN